MAHFFKVKTVLDEIRANGIAQTTGKMIQRDANGKVVAACAVGMGAHNLGIDPHELENLLYDVRITGNKALGTTNLASLIFILNDDKRLSFAQIADYVEQNFPNTLHIRVGF